MKRIVLIMMMLGIVPIAFAQQRVGPPHVDEPQEAPRIEEFIHDLTPTQRTRIAEVTKKHTTRANQCRKELLALRDSIRIVMEDPTDRSKTLFPLYDREGDLMAQLSKIYYYGRVEIEHELTPEQRKLLEQKLREDRERNKQRQGPPPQSRPLKDNKARK
ncbi:MAG: hypothetical protein IJM88_02110 [Bacteroidales bacterium]|nr:hypothetical protein [Bacteroidales bacterium]